MSTELISKLRNSMESLPKPSSNLEDMKNAFSDSTSRNVLSADAILSVIKMAEHWKDQYTIMQSEMKTMKEDSFKNQKLLAELDILERQCDKYSSECKEQNIVIQNQAEIIARQSQTMASLRSDDVLGVAIASKNHLIDSLNAEVEKLRKAVRFMDAEGFVGESHGGPRKSISKTSTLSKVVSKLSKDDVSAKGNEDIKLLDLLRAENMSLQALVTDNQAQMKRQDQIITALQESLHASESRIDVLKSTSMKDASIIEDTMEKIKYLTSIEEVQALSVENESAKSQVDGLWKIISLLTSCSDNQEYFDQKLLTIKDYFDQKMSQLSEDIKKLTNPPCPGKILLYGSLSFSLSSMILSFLSFFLFFEIFCVCV